MTGRAALIVAAWVCVPVGAQAHGMDATVESASRAVVLRFQYSSGEPADGEVLVYSPAEPARIYQRLRTDLRGRASFVPDVAGLWRVVADDGLGHRSEVDVSVDASGGATGGPEGNGFAIRDFVVASLVACALVAWWMLRRRGSEV